MRTLTSDAVIKIMTEYSDNYILAENEDFLPEDYTGNLIVLKGADDSDAKISDDEGRVFSPEIPAAVFNELQNSGTIQEIATDNKHHQSRFMLTANTKKRNKVA